MIYQIIPTTNEWNIKENIENKWANYGESISLVDFLLFGFIFAWLLISGTKQLQVLRLWPFAPQNSYLTIGFHSPDNLFLFQNLSFD